MRSALSLTVVLCSLTWMGASPPQPVTEEDKGPGFADLAFAASGTLVPAGDGTVRRLDGDSLPVVFDAGRKLVAIAASADGRQVAAVGTGVVARSSDGGRTFRVQPTPDGVMVYAVAWSRGDLLIFDVRGRGFRSSKPGADFKPLELPVAVRYWTASFSGLRGFVIGEKGVLLATEDGGKTWKSLAAPASDAEAVLTAGNRVWVSGHEGVFLSEDGGQHFRQVFTSTGNCYRMGARGSAVVVSCAPMGHVLVYAPDGVNFVEIPVPEAANMMSAGITPDGKLVAVGANDLLVLADTKRGRVIATSEVGRRWLEVMAKARTQEETRPRPSSPAEEPSSLPEGVVYRPGEAAVLTGIVKNSRGAPLAGIPVELVGSWAVHGEGYQKVLTGPDGRYRFKPSRVGNARVSVNAPEHAPISRVIPLNPSGETVLDVALQVEVQLAGTVLSAQGPVRGSGGLTLWPLPPESADMKQWRFTTAPVANTLIESDGDFHFQGVAAGEYMLEVGATGFMPVSVRVKAPDAFVQVHVSEGARVGGRLLSAQGAPVAGARASLRPLLQTEQALAKAGIGVRESARTDAQGSFLLSGVPDGDYELQLDTDRGSERICLKRPVAVRKGTAAALEVRLGQGPVIRGVVKDSQDRPVKGIEVLGVESDLCSTRTTVTGEDGRFVLRDVATPGRYKLYARDAENPSPDSGAMGEAEGSMLGTEVLLVLPEAP